MKELFITTKLIEAAEISEIHYDMYDHMYPEFDYDIDNLRFIELGRGNVDTEPISIFKLEQILFDLKLKGCNYIRLDADGDHCGYEYDGLHIYPSTESEIQNVITTENENNKNWLLTTLSEMEIERQRLLTKLEQIK